MKTRFEKFFTIAMTVAIPFLGGCAAVALVPTGYYLAEMTIPGGKELTLSRPSGGTIDTTALRSIDRIVAYNEYAVRFLQDSGLFPTVIQTSHEPKFPSDPARFARDNNADAFIDVQHLEAFPEGNDVVYGRSHVTIITADGATIYDQVVTLKQKANSVKAMPARDIYELLGNTIIADLKDGKRGGAQTAPIAAAEDGNQNWFKKPLTGPRVHYILLRSSSFYEYLNNPPTHGCVWGFSITTKYSIEQSGYHAVPSADH